MVSAAQVSQQLQVPLPGRLAPHLLQPSCGLTRYGTPRSVAIETFHTFATAGALSLGSLAAAKPGESDALLPTVLRSCPRPPLPFAAPPRAVVVVGGIVAQSPKALITI